MASSQGTKTSPPRPRSGVGTPALQVVNEARAEWQVEKLVGGKPAGVARIISGGQGAGNVLGREVVHVVDVPVPVDLDAAPLVQGPDDQARLLEHLALDGLRQRLANLDPTAREAPPPGLRGSAPQHEQDAAACIPDNGPGRETFRHSGSVAPPAMRERDG